MFGGAYKDLRHSLCSQDSTIVPTCTSNVHTIVMQTTHYSSGGVDILNVWRVLGE